MQTPFLVNHLMDAEKNIVLHRGYLDIIANILTAATGGARKTQLMYKCNLSFKQVKNYIDLLLNKQLLQTVTEEKSSKTTFFETTEKGQDFLRAYRRLRALTTI